MLYIQLADGPSAESGEASQGIALDYDSRNRVVGIEIEDTSKLGTFLCWKREVSLLVNPIVSDKVTAEA